jgi:hypothetical protein
MWVLLWYGSDTVAAGLCGALVFSRRTRGLHSLREAIRAGRIECTHVWSWVVRIGERERQI